MKKFINSLFLLCFCSFSFLQAQGIMTFTKETHDFANVEEGTIASYEFVFVNTGDQPIEIESVKASCGCTTPFWTQEVVFPGEEGKIKASYNSKGRPGPFMKSVTVRSNAEKSPMILYIKGFVNPAESSLTKQTGQDYQAAASQKELAPPSLRIDKSSHNFGRVETGNEVKQRFSIYNAGQRNLVITDLKSACKCVNFGLSTGVIRPSQTAILELSFEAKQVQNLEDTFSISSNDPTTPTKDIKLQAEVYENFGKHMFLTPGSRIPVK